MLKKLSISENTTLYDLNTYWENSIDEEGRYEEGIPEYDSWFHGCPKIKKIVITEPEKKWKKSADEEYERSGLYTENDMLFYTEPKTGLRAAQNNKKIKRFKRTAFCNCKKIKVWPNKKYLE